MVLSDLILIEPVIHKDSRGFFLESYREEKLGVRFVQDNHSFSQNRVLRGMHFQKGQAKFIYCPVGRIFDVAVDIRKGSKTYGQWQGFYLDEENHKQLFIPDGFAHGFCVLSPRAHVMYKVSSYFDKKLDRGFRFDDPDVGIDWPINNPILSERDSEAKPMREMVA